jgi:hypothetical protein
VAVQLGASQEWLSSMELVRPIRDQIKSWIIHVNTSQIMLEAFLYTTGLLHSKFQHLK